VVEDDLVPGHVNKLKYPVSHLLRVEHELLVVDGHAALRADAEALQVHVLHGCVPLL